ncbi:MAG: ParA family protein [Nitrosomonadales bacterium]|nr:ParA family protein [Nitrosomonadales bacterium]
MLTILVINSKGGSGKTTLATNLASYYAGKKVRTAIMDYDPQGSSMQWLRARPDHAEKIHAANAAPPKGASPLSSRQGWVPTETEVLIIDSPSGAKGLLLQELVRRANFIVIPVAPSPIDIRATADFIKDLFLSGGARTSRAKIAVVANRVRNPSSPVYAALERFLDSLKLPFLTSIRDTENYLLSAETGLGVFEMDEAATVAERRELMPIVKWLNGQFPNRYGSRIGDKTLTLEESKKFAALRTGTQTLSAFSATGKFRSHP